MRANPASQLDLLDELDRVVSDLVAAADGQMLNEMDDHAAVSITDRAILIRIAELWHLGMSRDELYEATRGHWKVGRRRERADLALAVAGGIVRGVFVIDSWHPAGTTPSRTDVHREAPPDRWEFVGHPAERDIDAKYLHRSVRRYFRKGNQNPIRYVNC
jgi:hypothetical protein